MILKEDCKFFRGDVPCSPHKNIGVPCENCTSYVKVDCKILIIKLGAAGDVIRTTPLILKIKNLYPSAYIVWLTEHPGLVPQIIDETLIYSNKNIFWLLNQKWDIVYNLDKEKGAISILEQIKSSNKYGFGMDLFGRCQPINNAANNKFLTGIFDDISKNNKKSYVEEIFEICDFEFSGEKYILEKPSINPFNLDHSKKIIGLNTGCGSRWPSRLWPNANWITLATLLLKNSYEVLWLGGADEHDKNLLLQKESGGLYFGHFEITNFINLMDHCDVVVTQVTMALHIAIGLEKRIILMNNIFNKYEFDLYTLGEIIEPQNPCGCYFNPVCEHESMLQITPTMILSAIKRQIEFL